MTRLKEMESDEKKFRSLALKTKVADNESSEESSDECSDTENLNLLRKRFQKFIKMKGKMKSHRSKRYNKKNMILIYLNLHNLGVVSRVT